MSEPAPRPILHDATPAATLWVRRLARSCATRLALLGLSLCLQAVPSQAQTTASVGLEERLASDAPMTLFYPTEAPAHPLQRGPFTLTLAPDSAPVRGNGRLVVISHGSGSPPWVQADLARSLVEAGFVVALPEHQGDNPRDPSHPGPDSWARRPLEVSRAIDTLGRDPRFASLLALDKVGVYGMSAGGHTALTLAGGRWSPGNYRRHCEANLEEDFQSCVGLTTRLTGGLLDGVKLRVARSVIHQRYEDDELHARTDPRIAAVVAGVPSAADFEMDSLAHPVAPLGLVIARQDRWLVPRFHSDRVRRACGDACEVLAELPNGGHGALLSPLPPGLGGVAAEVLNDPPGFDRGSEVPEVNRRITAFFVRHLIGP